MPMFNPTFVPPRRSRGGKILKQPYFEICTVPHSGPDAGRVRCKMTLLEFVPRCSGPLLRVGQEKACVLVGLRDGARVGAEEQPGWKHLRPQKNLLARTHPGPARPNCPVLC